ncbi:MAG: hypothetical protein E6J14_14130 [Chloroflexi bacterium]|nr:MAG: hypothetical protein E6J14_14130 [Chloroflexota bacterium]
MDTPWTAQLPAAVPVDDLVAEAAIAGVTSACCVFAADGVAYPERRGYAALVVAYSREGEPVAVLDDGAAVLLIRDGGVAAAATVAKRILGQAARVGLDLEMRVGVAALGESARAGIHAAREAARTVSPGRIAAA